MQSRCSASASASAAKISLARLARAVDATRCDARAGSHDLIGDVSFSEYRLALTHISHLSNALGPAHCATWCVTSVNIGNSCARSEPVSQTSNRSVGRSVVGRSVNHSRVRASREKRRKNSYLQQRTTRSRLHSARLHSALLRSALLRSALLCSAKPQVHRVHQKHMLHLSYRKDLAMSFSSCSS